VSRALDDIRARAEAKQGYWSGDQQRLVREDVPCLLAVAEAAEAFYTARTWKRRRLEILGAALAALDEEEQ
jgi:hypothetical protein